MTKWLMLLATKPVNHCMLSRSLWIRLLTAPTASVKSAVRALERPGCRAVGRFRNLSWGTGVRLPHYQANPRFERSGASNEPFHYHYYDPYLDFQSWVIIEQMLTGDAWHSGQVSVVDEQGQELFDGTKAAQYSSGGLAWEVAPDAVRIDEQGALHVDAAVPLVESVDVADVGDPRATSGFAGSADSGGGDGDGGM